MIKYLLGYLLILCTCCQSPKSLRQADFLWRTCDSPIKSVDFITIENNKIWLNKIEDKKSYLMDERTGIYIDSTVNTKPYTGQLNSTTWNIKDDLIQASDTFNYNVYYVHTPSPNRHGAPKRDLIIEDKKSKVKNTYLINYNLIGTIEGIITFNKSLLLMKFFSGGYECGRSIALINLDSLTKK